MFKHSVNCVNPSPVTPNYFEINELFLNCSLPIYLIDLFEITFFLAFVSRYRRVYCLSDISCDDFIRAFSQFVAQTNAGRCFKIG